IPAATRLARSGAKLTSQPLMLLSAQELLTTSGASGVFGLPSGSSSHWKPRWIALLVATPLSLKILTAIHCACGATPIVAPDALPPPITPIVQVPWPFRSVGVACWPDGSYQLLVPPRHCAARSGWV